jgi:hypothetical protein
MPMKWIEPELFATVDGVPIYHVYKEGNFEHRLTFHFTTDGTESDDGYEFDVRDVAAKVGAPAPKQVRAFFENSVKGIIARGLREGVITVPNKEE